MNIFILIIVIGYNSQSGKTTIQQEFNTLEQCEYTRKVLASQVSRSSVDRIIAHGCFKK